MKPELLKQARALKGKTVTVTYGAKPIKESGVLLSFTSGIKSSVWLTDHKRDISIPTELIHDIQEIA